MIREQLRIGGMTCVNCQNKIQRGLSSLSGVQYAAVSWQRGTATVTYDPDKVSRRQIRQKIEKLGYEVLPDGQGDGTELVRTVSLLVIVIALFVLLQRFGVLNLLVPSQLADSGMGYGMLFVAGLLTSVHCVAMCGGIHLSQCLPRQEGDGASVPAFLPSLLYNAGRVVSYTAVGFVLGLVGMLLGGGSGTGVPVLLQGILKLIAGAIMVVMGLNLLGVFPWLRRLPLHLPNALTKKLGQGKAAVRQPFLVGLLNGLMPCGPLQSMQILALGSGSPLVGALSMLLFSLGTVPLMLGLGTAVSALGKKFAKAVTCVGAVLVTVMGLAMLSQGGALSGWLLPDRLLFWTIALAVVGTMASVPVSKTAYRLAAAAAAVVLVVVAGVALQHLDRSNSGSGNSNAAAAGGVQVVDGVQMVDSTLVPGQYPTITVQAGIPVQWTIDAPAGSINGCNYRAIIQEYGIEHDFTEGENVIEFVPTAAGTYPYSCWMGMIRGSIIVTE